MANTNKNNIIVQSLHCILEKEKLTAANFPNWYRNLRIVLRQKHKLHIIDDLVPVEQAEDGPLVQPLLIRSCVMKLRMLHASC